MNRRLLVLLAALPLLAIVVITARSCDRSGLPEDLAQLIDRADRIVVVEEPFHESAVLFESSDRGDRDALKASLRLKGPFEQAIDACDGSPAIVLYANGEKIGQISYHHGYVIRCSLWEGDALLVDAEAILTWFDERKVSAPREEYEADLKLDEEVRDDARKWLEAMPASLKPLWPTVMQEWTTGGGSLRRSFPGAWRSIDPVDSLRQALAKQIPEKNARVLALFSWYGSGAGPWSGFPGYEVIAEEMLLDYSTAELLAAVEHTELTEAQTEGIARLFWGWSFSQRRPHDHQLLPAGLKARLLEHLSASADEDTLSRLGFQNERAGAGDGQSPNSTATPHSAIAPPASAWEKRSR